MEIRNNRGFTFVEILAVVAIMTILSGIAIVGVSRYREKQVQNNYDAIATSSYNAYESYLMKNGNTDFISITELKEGDFVSNVQDPKNKGSECTGNVFRKKDDTKIYVNLCCGDYKQQYSFYGQGLLEEKDEFESGTHTNIESCDVTENYEEEKTEPVPVTPPQEENTKTYSVKYSCSGATNLPSSQTKEAGKTLTLSSKTPTKSGYTFISWKDNSGNEYKPGSKYSKDKDLNLNCNMSKNGVEKYTIKYKCDGASNVPSSQTKEAGKTLTLSSKTPTRSGYTFNKWTGSDGKTYAVGAEYKTNKDLTLTCNMREDTYTVKIVVETEANDNNTYNSKEVNKYTKKYNEKIDLNSLDKKYDAPYGVNGKEKYYHSEGWLNGSKKISGSYTVTKNVTLKKRFKRNRITLKIYPGAADGICIYTDDKKKKKNLYMSYEQTGWIKYPSGLDLTKNTVKLKYLTKDKAFHIDTDYTKTNLPNVDNLFYKANKHGYDWKCSGGKVKSGTIFSEGEGKDFCNNSSWYLEDGAIISCEAQWHDKENNRTGTHTHIGDCEDGKGEGPSALGTNIFSSESHNRVAYFVRSAKLK